MEPNEIISFHTKYHDRIIHMNSVPPSVCFNCAIRSQRNSAHSTWFMRRVVPLAWTRAHSEM